MIEPTTLSEAVHGPVRPGSHCPWRRVGASLSGPAPGRASRDAYYYLILARALDERMRALNRQGKAPFAVSCAGHEAAQVGSALALVPGEDWVLPYYRDLGVMLVLGFTAREAMLQFLARAADPCSGGRQMPSHWSSRRLKVLSGSSPVATQILHATGVALASKLKGEPHVSAVYFGEGSTAGGDFHEGLNFAAIHRLPVVFVCENNGYAISQPQRNRDAPGERRRPGPRLRHARPGGGRQRRARRLRGHAAARSTAPGRARGPPSSRPRPTASSPTPATTTTRVYRSREEVAAWKERDPLDRFRAHPPRSRGADTGGRSQETRPARRPRGGRGDRLRRARPPPRSLPPCTRHVYAEPAVHPSVPALPGSWTGLQRAA